MPRSRPRHCPDWRFVDLPAWRALEHCEDPTSSSAFSEQLGTFSQLDTSCVTSLRLPKPTGIPPRPASSCPIVERVFRDRKTKVPRRKCHAGPRAKSAPNATTPITSNAPLPRSAPPIRDPKVATVAANASCHLGLTTCAGCSGSGKPTGPSSSSASADVDQNRVIQSPSTAAFPWSATRLTLGALKR